MKPQFFICRQNGALVPLVAVDELPPALNVIGIPRVLSHNDTHGMTSLGSLKSRNELYSVEVTSNHSGYPVNFVFDSQGASLATPKARTGDPTHLCQPPWNLNSQADEKLMWSNGSKELVKNVSRTLHFNIMSSSLIISRHSV